jgi:hypothetical protein
MPGWPPPGIILAMTRPIRSPKLLLVADPRPAPAESNLPVRRYRLARLQLDGRSPEPDLRFEHLKRVFD